MYGLGAIHGGPGKNPKFQSSIIHWSHSKNPTPWKPSKIPFHGIHPKIQLPEKIQRSISGKKFGNIIPFPGTNPKIQFPENIQNSISEKKSGNPQEPKKISSQKIRPHANNPKFHSNEIHQKIQFSEKIHYSISGKNSGNFISFPGTNPLRQFQENIQNSTSR